MIFLLDWCTFPWWLPWLLLFLLGLLLGWLIWGRFKRLLKKSEQDLDDCKKKRNQLEEDLAECRKSYRAVDSENAALRGSIREYEQRVEELEKEKDDQDSESRLAADTDEDHANEDLPNLETELDLGGGVVGENDTPSDMTVVSDLESEEESAQNVELTDLDADSELSSTLSGTDIGSDTRSSGLSGGIESSNLTSNVVDQAGSVIGAIGLHDSSRDEVSIGSTNMYQALQQDNLQIIEGIGPKMEAVLKENDIKSWRDLAGNTEDSLKRILSSERYGRKYQIIDPETWPEQAGLANSGNWDQLVSMQKDLNSSTATGKGGTDSKVEKILIKLGALRKYKKDDLKIIEGVGPKIESLMHNADIKTWAAMAAANADKLQEILNQAGDRFRLADPGTWPRQASLADAGQWDELEAYQERLQGGKE